MVNSLSLWPTNLGSAAPKDFTEADRVELAAARAAWAQLWRTLQARAKTPEPLTTEAWFDTRFESVKPDSGIAYFKHFNYISNMAQAFQALRVLKHPTLPASAMGSCCSGDDEDVLSESEEETIATHPPLGWMIDSVQVRSHVQVFDILSHG